MAAAAQKKLVIDVAKMIDLFHDQTGWDCKQWLMTMEHTCINVDFTEDQLLGVFKLSLNGVALLWWNNLNDDIKDTRPWWGDFVTKSWSKSPEPPSMRIRSDLNTTRGDFGVENQL